MACTHDELDLLVVPLPELCHGCISRAIELAGEEGVTVAGRDRSSMRGDRSKELYADFHDYWMHVVLPAQQDERISEEDWARWNEDFQSGRMMRDPRVQAFCSAWSGRAADMASGAAMRRHALEDFLSDEPSEEEVTIDDVSAWGHPIFARGDERFVVFLGPELKSVVEAQLSEVLHTLPLELLMQHLDVPHGSDHWVASLIEEFGEDAYPTLSALVISLEDLTAEAMEVVGLSELLLGHADADLQSLGPVFVLRWAQSGIAHP